MENRNKYAIGAGSVDKKVGPPRRTDQAADRVNELSAYTRFHRSLQYFSNRL